MAEGVQVEVPRSLSQKYFCHLCMREVNAKHPDLKCAECQSDFIEEVPDCPDGSDDSDDPDASCEFPWFTNEEAEEFGFSQNFRPFRNLVRRTILQTIFDFDQRDAQSFPSRATLGQWLRSYRPRRGSNSLPERDDDDDDDESGLSLFSELLSLHGNISDYAFGNDWDSIITQILNESSESCGPPPLPTQEIQDLPLISIEEEHINKGVQCTVCMEDFQLSEKVKNLPCEHIFHQDCIIPWLKMHATCPICRKVIEASGSNPSALHFDASSTSSSSSSSDCHTSGFTTSSSSTSSDEGTESSSSSSQWASSSSSSDDGRYDLRSLFQR